MRLRHALLAAALAATPAWAVEERPSVEQDQTALALTIYNNDLALVKDARRVRLANGENLLAWRDVSARMQPETALLRSLDGRKLTLLEQNFDFDLLTPQSLLENSVGETVRVFRPPHPMTGVEPVEQATVLAANNGVVLKYADRVETGVPGRLAFGGVPASLRERPTLGMLFRSEAAGDRALELSYLTGGLSWKADYVAELGGAEDSLDLNGWVTLTNTSGAAYRNALLQLVAGDVHRVRPEARRLPVMKAMAAVDAAPEMAEEGLFEYHLYTLARPTTLLDRQTKQVALLTAQQVPVAKEYVLQGEEYYYQGQHGELGKRLKAGTYLEFVNQGGSLGIPLPRGVMRVYKKDAAGRAQFVGEDALDHTAKGERVRLKLGEAFDITAEKKQTEYSKLAGYGGRGGVIDTGYELVIRNAKREAIRVKVVEPMPGDWQMLAESLPHRKETARTAVWEVPVPAEGKAVLTWRARIRY